MAKVERKFGWKSDIRDVRDFRFVPPIIREFPTKHSNQKICPTKILDQLELGSCTACAASVLIQSIYIKSDCKPVSASRLFTYYNTRLLEDTVDEDNGCQIRNVFKAIKRYGFCREKIWPYKVQKFDKKPPKKVYRDAIIRQDVAYKRVEQQESHIKSCLLDGNLIEFGFLVYPAVESKEVSRTGKCPMPKQDDVFFGGHAVVLASYDDEMEFAGVKGFYEVINSWGKRHGDKGHLWLPQDFVHNSKYCSDFWTLVSVPLDQDCQTYDELFNGV